MPKISIIMPVHNMAEYLEEVLSSWTEQTLSDIEILCIDDASTDNSPAVLKKWSEKDPRIVVHQFDENKTAWAARKWGIEHASAKYILFADADDTMELCACEELYAEMESNPVDILHFNANIINTNHLPESRIKNMQKFVEPYDGSLYNEEVFISCFEKNRYQFSLWNKMFSAELCKRAIQNMEDLFLPKAQDKLLYWIIALHAKSYRGIPKRRYYNYYFGRGGTGYNKLTLEQFERYCTMADTANAMQNYLVDKKLDEKFEIISQKNREALFFDCFARFQNEIAASDKATAFDIMLSKWNITEVVSRLAQLNWYDRFRVAVELQSANVLKYKKRKLNVIATYYHSCANGGAQRVMCDLCWIWASMGYDVVVFTDEEPTENDYPLPASCNRVVLPHAHTTTRENYADRAIALESALKEYHVDVMVYNAWVSNIILWDELICKLNGVAFVGHCHNVFSFQLMKTFGNMYNTIAPYILADAVVALSKVDKYFWQHFNPNVYETINPFTDRAEEWHASDSIDKKQILWLGRLSDEKRPYDALKIMKIVVAKIPDAHLHIVGSNPSEKYMEQYKNKIASLGLSKNVTMHGFQTQVRDFYQNASIFLMTSEYEGYPLTLQESKLAGLPCVMYDLPYLTLSEGYRGIVPVEANNIQAAADAVIDLLLDDNKRHQYAKDARMHIEELFNFDFAAHWEMIFSSIGVRHENTVSEESVIMLKTMLDHHAIGINNAKKSIYVPESKNWIVKKLKGGIQCCSDHGLTYTIKYAFSKLWRFILRKLQYR